MMIRILALSLLSTFVLCAQPFRWTREQMIHFTPENPFDRFADGFFVFNKEYTHLLVAG